ncbi:MAG: DUF4173 domain-containing protein [Chloroflexota bacterium]|nr:DUF4173 domain-containing protein [Chloroflexota bacterium]
MTTGESSALRNAGAIAAAAIAIGLLAQWLFVDALLGINAPIALAALLGAAWLVRPASRPPPRLRDAWLAIAALLFASFAALRGDVNLVDIDLVAALGLGGAALGAFAGFSIVDQSIARLAALGVRLAIFAAVAGGRVLRSLRRALPTGTARSSLRRAAPVLRGLAIALPLVLLFVALFAAADAVFARIAGDLFAWDLHLGTLPARIIFALVVAWLCAGLFAFVAGGTADEPSTVEAAPARFRIGSAEATTVMVVLDILFLGFVALQGAYLFGGQDTLAASGLTYAEYARRGFFELLVAAFAVGGLVLAAEATIGRRTPAYLAAAIGLVVLTAVVLGSALLRLRLYQEAYGWTELRFYVLGAIVWLAIGCGLAVIALAANRSRWLIHAMVAVSIVFGLAFNVIGPVRLVAEQNVERAVHPELVAPGGETGLDLAYLASLGDDALPVLAENLCRLPGSSGGDAYRVAKAWTERLAGNQPGRAWQAWNLSRERAREIRVSEICDLAAR